MKISGSRILLTGASGGLGDAIARDLSRRGADLVLTARRRELLDALAAETRGRVVVADLAVRADVETLIEESRGADVLVLNAGRRTCTVTVVNTGDRPVQVGSHYHFAETNPALSFDRGAARGCRLDIAAGTSVRHLSIVSVQRGWNRQPAGKAEIDGTTPEISRSRWRPCAARDPSRGSEATRPRV